MPFKGKEKYSRLIEFERELHYSTCSRHLHSALANKFTGGAFQGSLRMGEVFTLYKHHHALRPHDSYLFGHPTS